MTNSDWGRVVDDGTVYVKTSDGERSVGQYAEGSPEEALRFFTQRFESLETEVGLLEQRVRSGVLNPEEAAESVKQVRETVVDANAVGDLASLAGRLDSLGPVIAQQRAARKVEKAEQAAATKAQKEKVVEQAEEIAAGNDWRHGSARIQKLLTEWKELPRIDRSSDDALWKRFSAARSAYTKQRKVWFAEQDEKREGARQVKQRLVKEAESLSNSTEWGPTSGKYRDLMRDWKAAGPAPKDVEDELWGRFRGAQDIFFGARDAANSAMDAEFVENAKVKDELIVVAEALLPVKDVNAAKKAFRDLADKWDAAGKVPRDRMKELEGRMRKVEQAIRSIEDDQWKKTDPEKSARADDMVGKLEAAIADVERKLEAARASGNDKQVKDLEENLASRQAFLAMAQQTSQEFSG
ncbi:DUF349 domain-containing protein [Nocardioides salsibiostraticola]